MSQPFIFDEQQLNRLFPFYVKINSQLVISGMGKSMTKLIGTKTNSLFNSVFSVARPFTIVKTFYDLKNLTNQLVLIEITADLKLRGQIEYLPNTNELLLVGTPWLNAIENIKKTSLLLDDFAHHDALIDMLHVLKILEITNTDLKQLVKTTKEQQIKLAQAYKEINDIALFSMQNPDPIIRINFFGEVLKNNPAASSLDFFLFENEHKRNDEFFKIIAERINNTEEKFIIEATSDNKIYSFICVPLIKEGYINIYGSDITEKKESENIINRLSLVAKANTNGVIFTAPNGKIIWANEGFCILTGYALDEVIGKTPIQLSKGSLTDDTQLQKAVEQYKSKKSFRNEIIYYRKDKSWFWGRSSVQPITNVDGTLLEHFIIIENITEEKNAEHRFRETLERLGDNVWEYDYRTNETYFSSTNNELLGFTNDEIINNKDFWLSRIYKEDSSILEENEKNYLDKKIDSHVLEYRMIHKNGSIRWVLDRGIAMEKDENGVPVRLTGTHTDITTQKQLEHELRQARQNAESLAKMNKKLLANMSHEIRTPMNAIMGMARQLGKTNLNDEQQSFLDTIHSATDNLLNIINDILDISKIDAGKLILENIGFEPRKIISNSMRYLQQEAEEKGLRFTNSFCDNKLSPVLMGDPFRLNQVILNFISNAVKFTEKGQVDITCEVIKENTTHQWVKASIKDTGVGMDEKFLKNLFQQFHQEDASITRKYGGTGLGMSISKDIVTLMNGEIEVVSKKGEGTTVFLTIPFKIGTYADLPKKDNVLLDTSVLTGKKILIADDNKMNRMVVASILKNFQLELLEACNGQEVIDIIKNNNPDIVLMDVQMPDVDGITATKNIRENISKTLPIIALTAFALKGDNEKVLNAGMNDYIAKPFDETQLLNTLIKWLEKTSEQNYILDEVTATDNKPLYSLDKLKEIAMGNTAFVHEMIQVFTELIEQSLPVFEDSKNNNQFDSVKKVAHKIKPSLKNMGVGSIESELLAIETYSEDEDDPSAMLNNINTVVNVLQKIIENLKVDIPI
ncbi:MAG: response regulator [Niabella sp.]